ncbi:hypothetical protein N7462_010746 [Penicillium macrosclerotiorum]|uniref:uncharacterized protein n=1 Tax=Penicillium macrosclerotiorum TaxID=303699 RepID=UPI002547D0AC|nr:uncharacterized protein N7462_010746 [Penicillium macrosclerotiorum]KAJ5669676.1 hypothetical protein N7462_010746 [Penicillium macrosclerotiorum]
MSTEAGIASVTKPVEPSNDDANTNPASPPVADGVKAADVTTNTAPVNDIPPSVETCRKVEDYPVFDNKGNQHSFKSIYDGPDSPRRVLVIFIRHFFCGPTQKSCQEYVRALSESFKPADLLQLPVPTSFAFIGCGDPGLIDFYAKETGCEFPIFADPTTKLFDDLQMISTLALGPRPEYFQKSMVRIVAESAYQAARNLTTGLVTKAGDHRQVGGDFLFEASEEGGSKVVTWCHRMTTTRDHTSPQELAQILDKDGQILLPKNN